MSIRTRALHALLSPSAITAVCLAAFAGCGAGRGPGPVDTPHGSGDAGRVLTREDIAQLGGFTAMDVLERAGTYLSIARTRQGRPARITARGRGTLVLSPEVLLIVDGSRVSHSVQMLQSIPAESIVYIQILTAREAALEWGSEAGNGVIVVRTSAR